MELRPIVSGSARTDHYSSLYYIGGSSILLHVDGKIQAVPDVFFYGWGEETNHEDAKQGEVEHEEAVPDLVFVSWGEETKRKNHREEQS
ncbi:hypothetical protein F4810DRAFT_714919 [Camillea tinctor]|nr:hypothetical protein F4810DRAFT_714919 [Camillea tinctor]